MTSLACPTCGETDRIVGHEVRGVYDGVLFWSCQPCNRAFPRGWTGRRGEIAQSYVDHVNAHLADNTICDHQEI